MTKMTNIGKELARMRKEAGDAPHYSETDVLCPEARERINNQLRLFYGRLQAGPLPAKLVKLLKELEKF